MQAFDDSGLLFDTQAIILWAKNEVPQAVVARVEPVDSLIFVSIVSLWEFLLKTRYHDVGLDFQDFIAVLISLRAEVLEIRLGHLHRLRELPAVKNHRDPFDRMIISQAISENLTLVGGDRRFPAYRQAQGSSGLKLLWA